MIFHLHSKRSADTRIEHTAPKLPHNDDWGDRDSLLPKYQRKPGQDSCQVAQQQSVNAGIRHMLSTWSRSGEPPGAAPA